MKFSFFACPLQLITPLEQMRPRKRVSKAQVERQLECIDKVTIVMLHRAKVPNDVIVDIMRRVRDDNQPVWLLRTAKLAPLSPLPALHARASVNHESFYGRTMVSVNRVNGLDGCAQMSAMLLLFQQMVVDLKYFRHKQLFRILKSKLQQIHDTLESPHCPEALRDQAFVQAIRHTYLKVFRRNIQSRCVLCTSFRATCKYNRRLCHLHLTQAIGLQPPAR